MSNWSVRYDQFAVDSYVYFSDNLHHLRTEYRFPQQFFEDVIAVISNNKDPMLLIYLTLFAVGWTLLRTAFTDHLIKVNSFELSTNVIFDLSTVFTVFLTKISRLPKSINCRYRNKRNFPNVHGNSSFTVHHGLLRLIF